MIYLKYVLIFARCTIHLSTHVLNVFFSVTYGESFSDEEYPACPILYILKTWRRPGTAGTGKSNSAEQYSVSFPYRDMAKIILMRDNCPEVVS